MGSQGDMLEDELDVVRVKKKLKFSKKTKRKLKLSKIISGPSQAVAEDKEKLRQEIDLMWKGQRMRSNDVRCEPLLHILSAQVSTQNTDLSLPVRGDIKIVDLQGSHNVEIYERSETDDPQHISFPDENGLQLTGPHQITAMNDPYMRVNLRNADTDVVFASGLKQLLKTTHASTPEDWEQLSTVSFSAGDGELVEQGGSVDIHYAAFTFGVHAEVRVFLCRDKHSEIDEDDVSGLELSGNISGSNRLLLSERPCLTKLFNLEEADSEFVEFGEEIDLSRSLVVVPAYSSLAITVDLKGHGHKKLDFNGSATFVSSNYNDSWKDNRAEKDIYVRIHVKWFEPYLLNGGWCKEEVLRDSILLPNAPWLCARPLLEVFSVFIGRLKDEEVRLYGFVIINDSKGYYCIFRRDKNDPYFLSRGCKSLPLYGPSQALCPGDVFTITVNLNDLEGHVNIKGVAKSSIGINELQKPWFDRRLCSIVKGEDELSFAAIHYMFFSRAIEARVIVKSQFKTGSQTEMKVYGGLVAFYDKFSYSKVYEKDYYRTVLFTREEENLIEAYENTYLQLDRDLVMVSKTHSLLVDVNLYFQSIGSLHRIQKTLKFELGASSSSLIYDETETVGVEIGVEWRSV